VGRFILTTLYSARRCQTISVLPDQSGYNIRDSVGRQATQVAW